MAITATWKGEGEDGPQKMEMGGKTFKVGEALEVDQATAERLSKNRFFEISGLEPKEDTGAIYRAPSEQGAQRPAAKPGEPVRPDHSAEPVEKVGFKPIPKV